MSIGSRIKSTPAKVNKPTRFLVTGGAGFIGSRLVKRLAEASGSRVWVLDNLHPQVHGAGASSPPFARNVTFVHGDIRDSMVLDALVSDAHPEVVFHLAAETGTGQSYDEPARYSDVNVMGTARLIEALRHPAGNGMRRFVVASSRAVYGEGSYRTPDGASVVPAPRERDLFERRRFDPEDEHGRPLSPLATTEEAAPRPSSVYASTKLMQELLVLQCAARTPWTPVILRLQNVYGPGQSINNPYTGVLSIFSRQILEGRTLDIYEDGKIVRDFIFVQDVVEALFACGEQELPFGTIINIGSGSASTILTTAQTLLDLLGGAPDGYRITGNYRVGDVRYAVADIRRAQALLGWAPRTSFNDGLSQLAQWCRETFETQLATSSRGR